MKIVLEILSYLKEKSSNFSFIEKRRGGMGHPVNNWYTTTAAYKHTWIRRYYLNS